MHISFVITSVNRNNFSSARIAKYEILNAYQCAALCCRKLVQVHRYFHFTALRSDKYAAKEEHV